MSFGILKLALVTAMYAPTALMISFGILLSKSVSARTAWSALYLSTGMIKPVVVMFARQRSTGNH